MINLNTLNALFKKNEGPTVTAIESLNEKVIIALHVDEKLSWFEGHFPDHKVLPGIVQVNWAGTIGKALLVKECRFKQLVNIKFKTMVLPNIDMKLELSYSAEKGSLKFHYFNENESFSSGSFKFIPS
ncbi:3-hydroxyacyl-ACP dehydratase [Alteromonas ponticola]|uniref:3-hydroxyacyl-ACP dehydratase n=1 Tax=Alteromonas aquimaris TaxID=2998417 RepID=A0ABT3P808_9ALTE|nr:3-hydroxyacyl-ACP dehydratase [Alteromonas aquimaris]MCW8108908.1 3-hydroxyacyl-ACP dehydratase [Alteromonas aquimaris]